MIILSLDNNERISNVSYDWFQVIGGTSVVHGMMYMRGSRKDYDDWEKLGNEGWSYKDVLPYFKKSENNLQIDEVGTKYHSQGGYLPVTQFPYHPPLADAILKGAEELGQRIGDLNGESHTGFSIAQTTNRNGIRFSSARAFLRPVKHRANLHILLNTTVAKVLVDPTKKQAYGVEVINSFGQKQTFIAKKEVIVCGGAVNSPQILLLSGIGPKEDLEKVKVPLVHNLQGVGKNLHNHVAFRVPFTINQNATTALNWATVVQYLLYRDGLMSGTGMSQLTGMINTKYANPNEDNPDIQFFFSGYTANCAKTGEVGELVTEKVNGQTPAREISIIPTVLHPKSTGYLTLKDNNPLSYPKIFGKYLTNQEDVATLIEGIRFALKISKTKALQKYGFEHKKTPVKECDSKQFGTDQYWECLIRWKTGAENHQAGSCKMGPANDSLAVVDPELRVHGIKNLRVMDASIMPRVTSGNTGAPVVMIAEKGCDMIKKQWVKKN